MAPRNRVKILPYSIINTETISLRNGKIAGHNSKIILTALRGVLFR
jgi:hypothetical protein